jgi:membrane dipeptidase
MESLESKSHCPYYIVDSHCDTLSLAWKMQRDLIFLPPPAQSDFQRLKKAEVDLQFFSVFVTPNLWPGSISPYLQQIEFFHQQLEKYSDLVHLVLSYKDIDQAKKKGKLAALLCVEGGEVLEGDLTMLHLLYRLGVRSLGLTWNYRNALADGVRETNTGGGLTLFGRSVVQEMNELGMLIDVSHLSEAGFWNVLEISDSPIIASHSNCQSRYQHPRNLTDAQLKGLAQNGGVVGITLVNQFLGSEKPGLKTVLEHIQHGVMVMGSEHVGLGTDFDGVDEPVEGLEDVNRLPVLINSILELGFTKDMVGHIAGENYLRVLKKILK